MINAITGRKNTLYPEIKRELQSATGVKFIVSFIMESGVKLIVQDLKKLALKGVPIQIITGTYLGITEPSALYLLKNELGNLVDLRVYKDTSVSFHPKTYIIFQEEDGVVFIGSSNLSKSAFTSGIEWNYRIAGSQSSQDFLSFNEEFDYVFNHQADKLTEEFLKKYALQWKKPNTSKTPRIIEEEEAVPEPRGAQIEALYELEKAREEGIDKGIVVAATGIGKTYLAAFDSINFEKILFIAHRQEILDQTKVAFESIKKGLKITYFTGSDKDHSGDIVLASVQTLGKNEYLTNKFFEKDRFDYIVIDEFHHAAALSYKNVLNYFRPKFLLGLTATPYRMDNQDIFELCDGNVIYEIGLKNAINRDLLSPFRYYGVFDDIDYSEIEFNNGKYNAKQLEDALSVEKRADAILKKYRRYKRKRCVGFCSSIKHAEYMAKYFSEKGLKAVAVHSLTDYSEATLDRSKAVNALEKEEIEIIFAVDIFNEGVDIPSLDMVMFLRPTESYVVFLQQLGRGLRKYHDKRYLRVLDFIGNYKRAHYLPLLLAGENPLSEKGSRNINIEELDYPEGCSINFDMQLLDLFDKLKENDPLPTRMKEEYFRLKRNLGRRPTRVDIYEGVDIPIREYIKKGYLQFLNSVDELAREEKKWLDHPEEEFLSFLEKTGMSKSYKMPVLLSFIDHDKLGAIKRSVSYEEIGKQFRDFYANNPSHAIDLNSKEDKNWQKKPFKFFLSKAVKNPIHFLDKSSKGYFTKDEINKVFSINEKISNLESEVLRKHYEDIINLRTRQYFRRKFRDDEE